MSSYQPSEDQGLTVIPTVEITDYSEGYSDPTTSAQQLPSSSKKDRERPRSKEITQSGSDTERDSSDMSRGRKQHTPKESSGSKRHSASSKSKSRTDNWTDVTEPEERRRIQNRIAQRKFREKAREQKERAQRDSQNQEYAGSSYHTPDPDELGPDADVSGLPWGSFSMQYIVARGRESASQQGSRRTSEQRPNDVQQYMTPYNSGGYGQVPSYDGRDSSGDDAMYYDESPYFYDYQSASPDHEHGFGRTS